MTDITTPQCTCPSGDGSLRHPCPAHPPSAPVGVEEIWDAPALPEKWDSSRGYVEGWNDCRDKFAALARQPAAVDGAYTLDAIASAAVRAGISDNAYERLSIALAGQQQGGRADA